MLSLRMQRIGRKNNPAFRIVVTNSTCGPKSCKYVEKVGSYNPLLKEKILQKERIQYWISKGVQVSDTLNNLFISEGIIEGKKKNVLPKKKPIIKKSDKEEESNKEKESGEVEKKQVDKTEDKSNDTEKVV